MGRKIGCLLMVCAMAISLCGCDALVVGTMFYVLGRVSDDRLDKAEIFSYVQENQELLLTCIQERDYSAFEDHEIIEEVNADRDAVEFNCGGAGMGSETTYWGFYYTAQEDMTAGWGAPASLEELTPSGNGFLWKEEGGDNTYYTEKICRYFYYYETSY